jgi:hypothetical protein
MKPVTLLSEVMIDSTVFVASSAEGCVVNCLFVMNTQSDAMAEESSLVVLELQVWHLS